MKLHERVSAAEAQGPPDALACFDFGYLVETYKQASVVYERQPDGTQKRTDKPNPASNVDGYAWVEKAIEQRRGDLGGEVAEMEFAAVLITGSGPREPYHEHAKTALAGANSDSLLARNLASHFIGERESARANGL